MSFATLRREQMGGATGIYNLMRNFGGSVGISMATTPSWPGARRYTRTSWWRR